jgi:hypothetical protein
MSRYDSEQEKFYGRANFITDLYVGYKITQFGLAACLLVVMLLLRSDMPLVTFLTSFAVVWGFSYIYTRASMMIIAFVVLAIDIYAEKNSQTIVETLNKKLVGNIGKISFLLTCLLLIMMTFSNDPQSIGWHALLAPFALLFYIAKALFGI